VAEDDDFQIGLSHRALARPEQVEETAQEQIEEGPDHGGGLSQTAGSPLHSGRNRVSGPHGHLVGAVERRPSRPLVFRSPPRDR